MIGFVTINLTGFLAPAYNHTVIGLYILSNETFPPMNLKGFGFLLRETAAGWQRDNVARLSASLAFYTIFSLAPLLIIIVGLVGVVVNQMATVELNFALDQATIVDRIALEARDLISPSGENLVRTIFEDSQGTEGGILATIIGLCNPAHRGHWRDGRTARRA